MAGSGSLRILIADDDPQFRFCLCAQLSGLGHRVIAEAEDGRQAILLARQVRPDLIVMDIKMPNVDGLEASAQIGSEGLCPIILLSAYSDPQLIHEASTLPVQAYLVKPVREQELGPAIELAMARFQETQQLGRDLKHVKEVLNTRSAIKQATAYLVARHKCSPQEALDRIQQEARAKRVRLQEVATAIVLEKPVHYRYDAPV
jgi:response regulator NasT